MNKLDFALVLSVGEELLDGRVRDLNASYLATELRQLGLSVQAMYTIGDQAGSLLQLLQRLDGQNCLIISSGGLGPTADDRVRAETAQAMGVNLVEIAGARAELQSLHQKFQGCEAPPHFLAQGTVPEGGQALCNPAGTAWGFLATLPGGAHLMCLPGPPVECQKVWTEGGMAAAEQLSGGRQDLAYALFHTTSLPESTIEDRIRDLLENSLNPRLGITAHGKQVTLSLLAHPEAGCSAQALLDRSASEIEQRLGHWIWGRDQQTLEGIVVQELAARGQQLATAESCTGGLLASAMTGVPGASKVFKFGWVSYANCAKSLQLGVSAELMDGPQAPGAVSAEVAVALAEGARAQAKADWAIGITGIAGPGGGSADKPVGTVWIGLAGPSGSHAVLRQQWTRAGRGGVQNGAVRDALEALRRELLALPRLPERRF
jgi:competence/damage-inducible protein CinA-like protein